MNIDEVPEGHWVLFDKKNNVLYHSENISDVCREGKKYPVYEVSIQRKFTGLLSLMSE